MGGNGARSVNMNQRLKTSVDHVDFCCAPKKGTLSTLVFERWFILTLHAPFIYVINVKNFAHILTFFRCAPKIYVINACFRTLVHINTARTIYLRDQRRKFRTYTYLFSVRTKNLRDQH